ncbi:neutral zinc metallopeptidase [Prauserella muralis]|uniref:neutral zinc metallopeptidase n=1 Tax=Prauserella muralis TaxID=588067 RepID=UPI002013BE99|nr:neutral zinc metallopeptidase [Prauserella muralis]
MKETVDAGDHLGPRPRDAASPDPLIEDLPLSLWESTEQPVPAERPRRASRSRTLRRGLPVAVTLLLMAGLVAVVTTLRGDPDEAGNPPVAAGDTGGPERVRPESPAEVPLLTMGTAPPRTTCALPPFAVGETALRAYYRAELRCLERAWRPVLEEAGAPVARVGLVLADDPDTACGDLPPASKATGLYCDVDGTIYLPRARTLDALGERPVPHLATVAHEYGHHLQQVSGILGAANRQLAGFPEDGPEDRELSRRVELQANCLAGMFFASVAGRGSITADDADAAVSDFRNWIDSDTHGTSATQLRWARTGYAATTVAACDTWSVPREEVD